MKKINLILFNVILVLGLIMSSCSKDDKDEIAGGYVFDSAGADVKTNSEVNDAKFRKYLIDYIIYDNEGTSFTMDDKGVFEWYDDQDRLQDWGKYSLNGSNLSFTSEKYNESIGGIYNNGNITLSSDQTSVYNDELKSGTFKKELMNDLGITDPAEISAFKIEKAIVSMSFKRK